MSLCLRILASKPVKCIVSPKTIILVQTRGLRRELVPNVTHHSYYKIYKHGRSPVTAKSLAEVLAAKNVVDPTISYLVDIGLPPPKRGSSSNDKMPILLKNRADPDLEKKARLKTLEVSLEEVEREWAESLMPQAYCESAQHFGVFKDLYGDAFFLPRVPLNITFNKGTANAARVHRGNIILPSLVSKPPSVSFQAPSDSLWTLILTNPDGHLTEKYAEYVHWFIGNIPGNDVSKGEIVWDYLQPFPPHGTGYQRLVFVLYKQEEKIDYSSLKKKSPCLDLTQRTFNTYDFYKPRQDVLTPAGLCFYQSVWDQSVKSFFHNVLEMEAPYFLYDFPKDYRKKQRWFPLKDPFDLYLDKFADPKAVTKRYLIEKLTKVNPFEKPPPPLKFPLAQKLKQGGKVHTWLKLKMERDKLGVGHIRNA